MQEIDAIIDDQTQYAEELVRINIRNQQAHEELQSFNDTGQFKYVHKLTIVNQFKSNQRDDLKKLKEQNPEAFINEITNISQNIRRIESQINNKKYKTEQEHQSWKNNLHKAKLRRQIIIELM